MSDITMIKTLSIEQLLIYQSTKKSTSIAYILWWFLSVFGAHYFYLGGRINKKRAIWRLVISLTIIGFLVVWVLLIIDLFKLHGYVEERNNAILQQIVKNADA